MTTNEKALLLHEEWKGKLETVSKAKVASREDLALAYTPGVAEPCKAIARTLRPPISTPSSPTPLLLYLTAVRFLVLGISVPWPPCL